jgi:hypothetical protein
MNVKTKKIAFLILIASVDVANAQDTLNFETFKIENDQVYIGFYSALHDSYDANIMFTDTIYYPREAIRAFGHYDQLTYLDSTNVYLNSSFSIDHEIDTSMRIHTDHQKLQFVYFNHIIKFNKPYERIFVKLYFDQKAKMVGLTFSSKFSQDLLRHYISLKIYLTRIATYWESAQLDYSSCLIVKSFYF